MLILLNLFVNAVGEKEEQSLPLVIFALTFVLIPLFLTIFLIFQKIQISKWKKGFFPQSLKYNSDNLLKAYISLSGLLIRINPEESNLKFYYSVGYFQRKFPNCGLDFKFLLRFSLRFPIKSNMVCDWLNLHLKEDIYKLQVIYFLTGLAMVDKSLKGSEYKFLLNLVNRLGLKESEFQSIIAMYLKSEKKDKKKTLANIRDVDFEKKKSLKILGIKEGDSFDIIKKTYRILAMKYHPDKFETEGKDQVEIAKNRFITIQKAYEYLEKNY